MINKIVQSFVGRTCVLFLEFIAGTVHFISYYITSRPLKKDKIKIEQTSNLVPRVLFSERDWKEVVQTRLCKPQFQNCAC